MQLPLPDEVEASYYRPYVLRHTPYEVCLTFADIISDFHSPVFIAIALIMYSSPSLTGIADEYTKLFSVGSVPSTV